MSEIKAVVYRLPPAGGKAVLHAGVACHFLSVYHHTEKLQIGLQERERIIPLEAALMRRQSADIFCEGVRCVRVYGTSEMG